MDPQTPVTEPAPSEPQVIQMDVKPAQKAKGTKLKVVLILVPLLILLGVGGFFVQRYVSKNMELSKAGDAFTQFAEELIEGDADTAHTYMSENFQKTLSVAGLKAGMTIPPQSDPLAPGVIRTITESKKIQLNEREGVRLTVEYTKDQNKTHTLRVFMIENASGQWKVDEVQIQEHLN